MIVKPEISKDIEQKLAYIKETFGTNAAALFINNKEGKALEKEAVTHSFRIEHSRARKFNKKIQPIYNKDLKKVRRYLEDAWQFAKSNYHGELTKDFICTVSGLVDQDLFNGCQASYRRDNVRVNGAMVIPPSAEKVKQEMHQFVDEFNNMQASELEKAVFAHLHIARIHPFTDTNGRTARLVQNSVLKYAQLPPAIIYAGERHFYFDLLEQAIYGRKLNEQKRTSDEELIFFNYLATRVNIALDRIIDSAGSKK